MTAAAQGSAHMTKTEMLQLGTKTTWVRLSSGQATYHEMTVLRFELDEVSISHRKERVAVHHILRLWSTWARSDRDEENQRIMKSHGIWAMYSTHKTSRMLCDRTVRRPRAAAAPHPHGANRQVSAGLRSKARATRATTRAHAALARCQSRGTSPKRSRRD